MVRTIKRAQPAVVKQVPYNHLANLKGAGFKKGQSGNPNGRPKVGLAIAEILREIGGRPVTEWALASLRRKYGPNHEPKTMREAMLMAAYADAAAGDAHARDFIAERTEGKVANVQMNLNANQNTDDLTKMPLADILKLASELQTPSEAKA